MSEERHNKIVKINPQTFSTKMMYDIFLDFLQEGEDGWKAVRNKPWPYGAVLKVPNWKDGEYGYVGIMYGQIEGRGKKHFYSVNKDSSYGKWITESKNLQKLAYDTIFPFEKENDEKNEKEYEKEDWRFNNGQIREWLRKEQSISTKRYDFFYGNGLINNDVLAGKTSATVIMSTLKLTGTVKKGTYITIGTEKVVVTKDTSSYIHTYTIPKTDSAGNIMVDSNGNTIMDTVTENRIDIEFSPALKTDCQKGTEVNLPSEDKQYITVLTETTIPQTGYYYIREAEHFYTDTDVIWFNMFKQYEPSFDWNELMENTRKNPCAKRLGWSWYASNYPEWEEEGPIYPGEGCPAIASDPNMFSSVTWEGEVVTWGDINVPVHGSTVISWTSKYLDRLIPRGVCFLGTSGRDSENNLYVSWSNLTVGSPKEFAELVKNRTIIPIANALCSTYQEVRGKEQFIWHETTTHNYYSVHEVVDSHLDEYPKIVMQEILNCNTSYVAIEGEYNTVITPSVFTGYLYNKKGQIFITKRQEEVHYYYKNLSAITSFNAPWFISPRIPIKDALKKGYIVEIDFTKAVDLNYDYFQIQNDIITIPYGLYYFPSKKKYLIVFSANSNSSTAVNMRMDRSYSDSNDIELIMEYLLLCNKSSLSGCEMLAFIKDYDTQGVGTSTPGNSEFGGVCDEYVYLYMSKTKHNANLAVNYRDWWDMAQIGFFEPFASDYEYQFPAMAMSSNIGVRPCNHLVSYGSTPYPYDNMLFDYTQGNRSWGHSMIGYSATWWDGTQEFLDEHACSQTQAMLPSGKWASFFNYAIRNDYWYSYIDGGHYSHGYKEPEKVDSKYFITNTMTPNVEENFNVIPYSETANPLDMLGGVATSAIGMEDIFKSWNRVSCNEDGTSQNDNSSEQTAARDSYSYDKTNNVIICSRNSGAYSAFISEKKYGTNWSLEYQMDQRYAPNQGGDDDLLQFVVAYMVDSQGVFHTLSVNRAGGTTSHGGHGFYLAYDSYTAFRNITSNWINLAETTVKVASWYNNYTKVKVERTEKTITAQTADPDSATYQYIISWTLPASKPSDWSDEAWDNISYMMGNPSNIGFGTQSNISAFKINYFKGLFELELLDKRIELQNKQSYSLLPFYLGTSLGVDEGQNMICAVPAMYAVSRPVTRYGLYRNPADKEDFFLIMPNCWEGRPWHYQQDAARLYTGTNKIEEEQQEEYDKYRDWGKNMNVAMHIGKNTSVEEIENYIAKTKEFD